MALDLEKIQDSPHLLDLLLQMEDVLDSLDIYVFKNWFLGEVVEGPIVKRYWLDFTLKYAYDKMPDPKAMKRLLKHGIRVDFYKARLEDDEYVQTKDNLAMTANDKSEEKDEHGDSVKDKVWLVHISIPRRLVTQMSDEEMDFYDEEVDVEDVEDAKDTGIDDESAYTSGPGEQENENTEGDDEEEKEDQNA